MSKPEHHVGRPIEPAYSRHGRNWRRNRYVYPVCSRRSGGLSIGINLSPDQQCNFNCVYCQVDRTHPTPAESGGPVELAGLRGELADMLAAAASGRLLDEPEFADLPERLRRVNDIAFSGNGEPTAASCFADAVKLADELNQAAGLDATLVLITNATLLDRPAVRDGLEALHRHRGEVWAKLDAGEQARYQRVDRSRTPLAKVLANITWSARRWPIVIQSCFMRLAEEGPAPAEIEAYCDRLAEVLAAGGTIKLVQVYTVARRPAEQFVSPLPADEVDAIVARVRDRLAGRAAVQGFYGPA